MQVPYSFPPGAFWPNFFQYHFPLSPAPADIKQALIVSIRKHPLYLGQRIRVGEGWKYMVYDTFHRTWENGMFHPFVGKMGRRGPARKDSPSRGTCPLRVLLHNALRYFGLRTNNAHLDVPAIISTWKAEQQRARKKAWRSRLLLSKAEATARKEARSPLKPLSFQNRQILVNRMTCKLKQNITKCPQHCAKGKRNEKCSHRRDENQWVKFWIKQARTELHAYDDEARRNVRRTLKASRLTSPFDSAPRDDSTLNIVFFNVNGLQQNGAELLEATPKSTHVIALQETRLSAPNRSRPRGWHFDRVTDWTFLDHPRASKSGGGTGFLIRPSILAEPIPQGRYRDGHDGCEWMSAKVKATNGYLYFISVYFPPAVSQAQAISAAGRLQQLVEAFSGAAECIGILLGGDFNAFPWTLTSIYARALQMRGARARMKSKQGLDILSTLVGTQRHQPHLVNNFILRHEDSNLDAIAEGIFTHANGKSRSVLDFALYFGDVDDIISVSPVNELFRGSDHRAFRVVLNTRAEIPKERRHYKLDVLKTADEDGRLIKVQDLHHDIDRRLRSIPQDDIVNANEAFHQSFKLVCGLKHRKVRVQGATNRWWSSALTTLSRKLKRLRRTQFRARQAGLTLSPLAADILSVRKQFRTLLDKVQRDFWNNLRESWAIPARLAESIAMAFRIINSKSKVPIPHTTETVASAWSPIIEASPPAASKEATARLANEFLSAPAPLPPEAIITSSEVTTALARMHRKKATGLDEVSVDMLQHLPSSAHSFLASAFTRILAEPSLMPKSWHEAVVVLIPKSKESLDDPLNMRPITLLQHTAKLMERIILTRLESLKLPLTFIQGGFQNHRGCTEQAWKLRTLQEAMATNPRSRGMIAFLDIRKAYDSVPHNIIINKIRLRHPTIPTYLLRYLLAWIQHHRRRILVNGNLSGELHAYRGLPQGSILAPFLFNLFLDDLLEQLDGERGITVHVNDKNGNSEKIVEKAEAFADDLAVVGASRAGLQRSLKICELWGVDNGIEFSAAKSKVLSFGRIKVAWKVTLYGTALEAVPYFDYLGIRFHEDPSKSGLDSSRFTLKIVDDARRQLHVQYSAINHCPIDIGRRIILLKFLPQLLYGCEVFEVPSGSSIQATAWAAVIRRLLNAYHTDSHEGLRKFLGTLPVHAYATLRAIKFAFKMLSSPFEPLRSRAEAIWLTDLPWVKYIQRILLEGHDKGYFISDSGEVTLHADQIKNLASFLQNSFPSPTSRAAFLHVALNTFSTNIHKKNEARSMFASLDYSDHGYIAFRFLSGTFNPRDKQRRKDEAKHCFLCNEPRGDSPEHLPSCKAKEIQESILPDLLKQIGWHDNSTTRTRVGRVLQNPTNAVIEGTGLQKCTSFLSSALYRLWRLRKKHLNLAPSAGRETNAILQRPMEPPPPDAPAEDRFLDLAGHSESPIVEAGAHSSFAFLPNVRNAERGARNVDVYPSRSLYPVPVPNLRSLRELIAEEDAEEEREHYLERQRSLASSSSFYDFHPAPRLAEEHSARSFYPAPASNSRSLRELIAEEDVEEERERYRERQRPLAPFGLADFHPFRLATPAVTSRLQSQGVNSELLVPRALSTTSWLDDEVLESFRQSHLNHGS